MLYVVYLSGLAGSGKDEFARRLIGKLKETTAPVASIRIHDEPYKFADELWAHLCIIDPLIPEDGINHRFSDFIRSKGREAAKDNSEVRRLLQIYGTDIVRDRISPLLVNPRASFWVECLERKLAPYAEDSNLHIVVISDKRFTNERFTFPHSRCDVRIERPGVIALPHKSEALNDLSYDLIVYNSGSLEDLNKEAYRVNMEVWGAIREESN